MSNLYIRRPDGRRHQSDTAIHGKNTAKIDTEETCKIKTVSHFTEDLKKLKQKITALEFPKGGALTSLALLTAKAELALGRKQAKSVVIVLSAGRPLSYRKTQMASAF